MNQIDCSILVGTLLDHFDSALYGFLVPAMAPLFFQNFDPTIQLIIAYSLLGTSLFSRPAGIFIFNHIIVKKGPLKTLSLSMLGLTVCTICIGLLPTYATLGWYAPFSLAILRFIKGIFSAGEHSIAKLYFTRQDHKNSFNASQFYQSSSLGGIIIASTLSTIIFYVPYNFLWRLCFLLSGIVGLVCFFIRRQEEHINSKLWRNVTEVPSLKCLWIYKWHVLRIASLNGFSYITYTLPFIFMNVFAPLVTSISLAQMMGLNTFLLILDCILIFILSRFLHTFKIKTIMISTSLVIAISTPILFFFLPNASVLYVVFVRCWIIVFGVAFLIPLTIWKKNTTPTHYQFFIVGIGSELGAATMGRMTTTLCLFLWHITKKTWIPALYVSLCALLAAIAILFGHTQQRIIGQTPQRNVSK